MISYDYAYPILSGVAQWPKLQQVIFRFAASSKETNTFVLYKQKLKMILDILLNNMG